MSNPGAKSRNPRGRPLKLLLPNGQQRANSEKLSEPISGVILPRHLPLPSPSPSLSQSHSPPSQLSQPFRGVIMMLLHCLRLHLQLPLSDRMTATSKASTASARVVGEVGVLPVVVGQAISFQRLLELKYSKQQGCSRGSNLPLSNLEI